MVEIKEKKKTNNKRKITLRALYELIKKNENVWKPTLKISALDNNEMQGIFVFFGKNRTLEIRHIQDTKEGYKTEDLGFFHIKVLANAEYEIFKNALLKLIKEHKTNLINNEVSKDSNVD
ncbi:hypothetical protein [Helicobacter sp. T3_23-1056]